MPANQTLTGSERTLAALAWLRGPITALIISKIEADSPFVTFQTRQAVRFYTAAFVAALLIEALLAPLLLLLLLAWEFGVVLGFIGTTPDLATGEGVIPITAALLLGAFLVVVLALIPAALILGSAHLVGLVVALAVWRGHNVCLPFFASWAKKNESTPISYPRG